MQYFAKRAFWFLAIGFFITSCDSRQDRIAAAEEKNRLAEIRFDQGRYAEAATLAKQAVNELLPLLGSDDTRTIDASYNLGAFLKAAGQISEAIAQGRIVVATSARALGQTNETTLNARLSLASALREVNNSEGNIDEVSGQEAEDICRTTLMIAEKEYGPENAMALRARQSLSITLAKRGNYKEAIRQSTLVLEMQRLKLGNDADETLTTRMSLATALLSEKLYEPAQKEFQTVYEIRKKTLGPDHPETIRAEDWFGASLVDQKRLAEALPILRDVWARKKRILGEAHRGTLASGFNLATSEVDGGNREESKRILKEIHGLALKSLGPEDAQTQMYQNAIKVVQ